MCCEAVKTKYRLFLCVCTQKNMSNYWGKRELTPGEIMWRNCEKPAFLRKYQTELNKKNRKWNSVCIVQFYQLFIDFKMVGLDIFWKNCVFDVFWRLVRYPHLNRISIFVGYNWWWAWPLLKVWKKMAWYISLKHLLKFAGKKNLCHS